MILYCDGIDCMLVELHAISRVSKPDHVRLMKCMSYLAYN